MSPGPVLAAVLAGNVACSSRPRAWTMDGLKPTVPCDDKSRVCLPSR